MTWVLIISGIWAALFFYAAHDEIADAWRCLNRRFRRALRLRRAHTTDVRFPRQRTTEGNPR